VKSMSPPMGLASEEADWTRTKDVVLT